MIIHFKDTRRTLHTKRTALTAFFLLISLVLLLACSACKKQIDYSPYVSELRNDIFLAKEDGFSLRIYAVTKENPYQPDGIPHEQNTRVEVYLTAPEGNETCKLSFVFDGREFGGEMSYDNVKSEYFFSCSLNVFGARVLPCHIEYGDKSLQLEAKSVRTETTLSAQSILQKLQAEENELFTTLTDKYGFAGEIYIRLIYEDLPYYYVGVIDRNGKVNAFLMNAQTGKILAKHTT